MQSCSWLHSYLVMISRVRDVGGFGGGEHRRLMSPSCRQRPFDHAIRNFSRGWAEAATTAIRLLPNSGGQASPLQPRAKVLRGSPFSAIRRYGIQAPGLYHDVQL